MVKTIKDINKHHKKALLRVDYNVSLLPGARVADDFRLEQSLPTLRYLLKEKCTIFLLSHLDRPGGKVNTKYSLKPVAEQLSKLIKHKVYFFGQDYTTDQGRQELNKYQHGDIVLLENVRFYPGEEQNDKGLAKKLSLLADVFINDAFGVCHRQHASVVGIPQFLPSAAGLLLEKEIRVISQAIDRPRRPLVAIIGGAKIEDKLAIVKRLIDKADYCLVGGKIANALLKVKKSEFDCFKVDQKINELAQQVFWQAAESKTALVLPLDAVVREETVGDIGPKTREKFKKIISQAKTIIWVGTMGIYEREEFSLGTEAVYQAVAENRDSQSIIGGGDTMAALKHKHYLKTIDHVSTGGGAMLEFIEKGTLPGIEVLEEK
jgi:3-phosphoglycerate kinase